jgi:hypothetical protein
MYPHYDLTNLWLPSPQFIQVGACEVAAVYLHKLQASHSQLLEALAQRAAQDSAAAEAQATEASTAIENARMALAQRKVALATAQQDADAQVCGGVGGAGHSSSWGCCVACWVYPLPHQCASDRCWPLVTGTQGDCPSSAAPLSPGCPA